MELSPKKEIYGFESFFYLDCGFVPQLTCVVRGLHCSCRLGGSLGRPGGVGKLPRADRHLFSSETVSDSGTAYRLGTSTA